MPIEPVDTHEGDSSGDYNPSAFDSDSTACDREPIHIPGSIQPHGLLLIANEKSLRVIAGAGDLESRLAPRWLGETLDELLGHDNAIALVREKRAHLAIEVVKGISETFGAVVHWTNGKILIEMEPRRDVPWSATRMLGELDRASRFFEEATDLVELASAAAKAFRSLTGYDRVMVYRFVDDGAGVVVAEDCATDMGSFLNHHFPASDIPKQARQLYIRNRIRVIPDTRYVAAPIRPAGNAATTDLSDVTIRSVSPVHLQYLSNMGVGASASMSIVKDDILWGLIACHNREPLGIPYDKRLACEQLASDLARQIRSKDDSINYREETRLRGFEDAVVGLLHEGVSLGELFANAGEQLCMMLSADGFAAVQGDDLFLSGHCPDREQILALGNHFAEQASGKPVASHNLEELFAPAKAFRDKASGMIAVTMSTRRPTVMMWFRAEQIQVVNWAGDPNKGVGSDTGAAGESDVLTPRASFESWKVQVGGHSARWTGEEIEAAARLTRTVFDVRQNWRLRELNSNLSATIADKESLIAEKNNLIAEVKLFERAVEAVSVGVTISDATAPDMPLIYCNRAFEKMTGYSRQRAIGRNCRFLQGPATEPNQIESVRTAIRDKVDHQVVLQNYRADGQAFWNEFTISPVPDANGKVRQFVGIQVDISERLKAEASLADAQRIAEEASEAKSQFIANMSHELRTPLSAIIGYSELLDEEASDLGECAITLRKDIAKVTSSAHHLLNLINGALDIAKIEAGKMEVEIEEFDIRRVVQDVANVVTPLVEKRNNVFSIQVGADLSVMRSDETKLRQCLLNLLSNAAKFTENGSVALNVSRINDDAIICVRDSGVGMSAEQVGKVFERFSQADASTTRKYGGTGLGLSITKAFADMLGGKISVESEVGQGSAFILTLPLDSARIGTPTSAIVEEDPAGQQSSRRVLVIDDDASHRELIGRFLIRQGLVASYASGGLEGLRIAQTTQPSLILLDVHMPEVDGWAVLTALKDNPKTASIPVVMVTIEHDRARGLALGANNYLTKPVDWKKLGKLLEGHTRPVSQQRALIVGQHKPDREDLAQVLGERDWKVTRVKDIASARKYMNKHAPAAILVDLEEVGVEGLRFINDLEKNGRMSGLTTIVMTRAGDRSSQAVLAYVRDPHTAAQFNDLAQELARLTRLREGGENG